MKQYLMMCNEQGKSILEFIYKDQAVQFLEVQGMTMAGNNVNIIVTPIQPPLPPMPTSEEPLPPPPPEEEEKGACYLR